MLNKLRSRGFRAASLSTYDFFTLYTTLLHNLIKEKLIDLIQRNFKEKALFTFHAMMEMLSSRLKDIRSTHYGHAKRCAKLSPFFWIIIMLDFALSYTDRLWVFRWVLTVLPL